MLKIWILMTMLWVSISASAYDFEVDGIYYNITSMADLEVGVTHKYSSNPVYDSNASYSGQVSIPSTVNYNNRTFTVTSILPYAMGGTKASDVTEVSLPNTIEIIDSSAFQNCSTLNKCEVPASVKEIRNSAFFNTALTEVVLQGATTIGGNAFYGCKSLNTIVLGENIETISSQAFYNCRSLLEVFFTGNKKPNISSDAFYNTNNFLEKYVPSIKTYGFGREYLSFASDSFDYTGQPHNIEWTNNLKAYKCEIDPSDCITEANAGQYTKTLKATYSDGIDVTVDIPYDYVINKAPMTLTVEDAERVYGEPNPIFTCNISGFVNGENEVTLGTTPLFECAATQLSNVGTYRILASLDAPNYDITYKYGTLSVVKAPLSVGVSDATKIYGNQNPDFSLLFSGLKNEETSPVWTKKPVISTSATAESKVGQYEITVGDGVATNYEIAKYLPGFLTVSPRNLTVKAIDCERLYGEDNPIFGVSYLGFVNGDTKKDLLSEPVADCSATKSSDSGTYPINVSGGTAENYSFVYQDGTLTIKPLTVGFKNVYNTVTYNDMSVSTTEKYFNYLPEVVGPFSVDDFWVELWFLDKDNIYSDMHVATITGGEYAGNYVNTNEDRRMEAGKYIFNLTTKGTNPNVVANPSRAYLTVNRASNNLEWNAESPIHVKVGETVDLGISYQADLWCTFDTEYDKDMIELSSEGANGNNPHWYVTGIKEGETTLSFGIVCHKNDMGFYDFTDSRTLSKRIKVEPMSGIEDVVNDENATSVNVRGGSIYVSNKPQNGVVRVFNLQGIMLVESEENVIHNLSKGLYIVMVSNKSFKVKI